jgi:hypothetical protein
MDFAVFGEQGTRREPAAGLHRILAARMVCGDRAT